MIATPKFIFNRTVLEDKFSEGDQAIFDYLIDCAEDDGQVEALSALKEIEDSEASRVVYYVLRNQFLFENGVDIREFEGE